MNFRIVRESLSLIVVLTVITGIVYPVVVTGVALGIFPDKARGSIIERNGRPIGSALIGQNFSDPAHFWGRPSATAPQPYNAVASGGSNQGPLNPALIDKVKAAAQMLKDADSSNAAAIPVDLVTASASGLDPDITPAAAYYQASRVAKARKLPLQQLIGLVNANITPSTAGFIGEPRINVLRLNLALDQVR